MYFSFGIFPLLKLVSPLYLWFSTGAIKPKEGKRASEEGELGKENTAIVARMGSPGQSQAVNGPDYNPGKTKGKQKLCIILR